MFNRELRVKFVKPDAQPTKIYNEQSSTFEGKTAIIGAFIEKGFKNVGIGVVAYVAADTLRQVIVARASR